MRHFSVAHDSAGQASPASGTTLVRRIMSVGWCEWVFCVLVSVSVYSQSMSFCVRPHTRDLLIKYSFEMANKNMDCLIKM